MALEKQDMGNIGVEGKVENVGEIMVEVVGEDKMRISVTKVRYATSSPSQYVLLYAHDAGGRDGVETCDGDKQKEAVRNDEEAACDGKGNGVFGRKLVVFIHGGFWKSIYGLEPMTAACGTVVTSLLSHGYDVAMVEYRRDQDTEWGFPHTNYDVLTAYRCIICHYESTSSICRNYKVALMGHSAGGTLALWLTAHLQQHQQKRSCSAHDHQVLRESELNNVNERAGATSQPRPIHTYALAPVSNLSLAVELRLSDNGNAVQNYMHGTPEDIPHAYDQACPTSLAPHLTQSPITLLLGDKDDKIPPIIISTCFEAIKSLHSQDHSVPNTNINYVHLHDTDHFSIVDASSHAWQNILQRLKSHFNQSPANFPV